MEVNALIASIVAGLIAFCLAAGAVVLSRVSLPLLPGFDKAKRGTLDLTQGMRAAGLQYYAYYFFALGIVFALYCANIRSTTDFHLTTAGGENLIPLSAVFLIPFSAFAAAASVGSHESATGHLQGISIANGLSLFFTAQEAGHDLAAWGPLLSWWFVSAIAMSYVVWQTMTIKTHALHYLAVATPVLVSGCMWVLIVLSFTFDIITVNYGYYFFVMWLMISAGLISAAINFVASAQVPESYEEVNKPKRAKYH